MLNEQKDYIFPDAKSQRLCLYIAVLKRETKLPLHFRTLLIGEPHEAYLCFRGRPVLGWSPFPSLFFFASRERFFDESGAIIG